MPITTTASLTSNENAKSDCHKSHLRLPPQMSGIKSTASSSSMFSSSSIQLQSSLSSSTSLSTAIFAPVAASVAYNRNGYNHPIQSMSTKLTRSNHIDCFHQRTRSLPLTEEETIVEPIFPSVSLNSFDGSKVAVGQHGQATPMQNSVSSLSSMHSSSSSSSMTATNNFDPLDGSSILRKLCEALCSGRNADGSRKHQPKCCFYHLDKEAAAMQTQSNQKAAPTFNGNGNGNGNGNSSSDHSIHMNHTHCIANNHPINSNNHGNGNDATNAKKMHGDMLNTSSVNRKGTLNTKPFKSTIQWIPNITFCSALLIIKLISHFI